VWPGLLNDFAAGRLQRVYRQARRPPLSGLRPDRSIFAGKRYLPVGLVEAGRGCHFRCEFCAVQSYFGHTQTRRPSEEILEEVRRVKKPLIFFVDDNITSNMQQAKDFFRALIPLKIKWVSQASINAAHDEEFLDLVARSGCQGLLVGFESLEEATLRRMNKSFNTMRGGYEVALANLRRFGIRLYATFVFGYDEDRTQTFTDTLAFARRHAFYIAAFNHLTPFPGTPLYARMEQAGQLRYDAWWLDARYRYNDVPFHPRGMTAEELHHRCLEIREAYYSLPSILRRFADPVNRRGALMSRNFPLINLMLRKEVRQRDCMPLGDEGAGRTLIEADGGARRAAARRSLVAL